MTTITIDRVKVERAVGAMERTLDEGEGNRTLEVAAADLREALNAPQPEPVAWKHGCAVVFTDVKLWTESCPHCGMPRPKNEPVTTPRREWVGLTNGDIENIAVRFGYVEYGYLRSTVITDFARAIEQASKERNHE